jgi:hypothetical protein
MLVRFLIYPNKTPPLVTFTKSGIETLVTPSSTQSDPDKSGPRYPELTSGTDLIFGNSNGPVKLWSMKNIMSS